MKRNKLAIQKGIRSFLTGHSYMFYTGAEKFLSKHLGGRCEEVKEESIE